MAAILTVDLLGGEIFGAIDGHQKLVTVGAKPLQNPIPV